MQGIEEFIVVTVGRGFLVGELHALDYFCITNMDFLTDSGAFLFPFLNTYLQKSTSHWEVVWMQLIY